MADSDPPTSGQPEAAPEPGDDGDEAAASVQSSDVGDEEPSSVDEATAATTPDAAAEEGGSEASAEASLEEEPFDPAEQLEQGEPATDAKDGADGAAPPPAEPTLEERLAAAEAAKQRVREQLLRVAADFDNFRKRSQRDIEDARRRARQTTLRDLFPVFDNLERATAHDDPNVDVAAVAEGIRMVIKQFLDTLKRLDVERIDAVGAAFDPAIHESFQLVESAEHAPGTVVSVVQPGYRMGDDLLRPALVAVCKGPPPEPSEAARAEEAATDDAASSAEVVEGEEPSPPDGEDDKPGEDGDQGEDRGSKGESD